MSLSKSIVLTVALLLAVAPLSRGQEEGAPVAGFVMG